jgi:hypothetical protein
VIFRREPLHRKLARQAGLELDPDAEAATATAPEPPAPVAGEEPRFEPEPIDVGPQWGMTGLHGVPRPRRWDTVATAEAPGLTSNEVHFVGLANGDLVVDEDEPDGTLAPLAEAVESSIEPPYRAEAVRREADVWAVAARRVQIAELESDGDRLQLTSNDGERTLTIDGEPAVASLPELARLGEREGDSYVVQAQRLDDRLWEVTVDPL